MSINIAEGVTAGTRTGLECLSLANRVEVVTADAAKPFGRGVSDQVMVTVPPWSLPEAWVEQLVPDDVLVVPLSDADQFPNRCRKRSSRRSPIGPRTR